MDANDYYLNNRMKAIEDNDRENEHKHVVRGYVIVEYPVEIEYDDREYNDDDIEELLVEQASKDYDESIYYMYDKVEWKEDKR